MDFKFDWQIVESNGWKFYVLPKDWILYRGDTARYLNPELPLRTVEYFTTLEDTENYGVPIAFKLTENLRLFALDDVSNALRLYKSAPGYIKKALEIALNVKENGEINLVRHSIAQVDRQIADYICQLEFDGYATMKMDAELGGIFHPEIALCHPEDKVYIIGTVIDEIDPSRIQSLIDKYRMVEVERSRKESIQDKRRSRINLGDDDPENTIRRGTLF